MSSPTTRNISPTNGHPNNTATDPNANDKKQLSWSQEPYENISKTLFVNKNGYMENDDGKYATVETNIPEDERSRSSSIFDTLFPYTYWI